MDIMCLNTSANAIPVMADKDITVYKVVLTNTFLDRENDNRYKTPFMFSTVEMGAEYTSTIEPSRVWSDSRVMRIEKGIHSFENFKDAAELVAALYHADHLGTPHIAECIIPKGSWYYKGTFLIPPERARDYLNVPSFASDKIKYLKIIEQ